MSSATAASPTAASASTPTTTRRRSRASSQSAAAPAPPSSASSSRMPAARPRRSGRGKAAARSRPGEDPWQTIAPSAIPFGEGWHMPREATEADIERVRDAFVAAAKRAVRIGFDAIELHMAHGYLMHGFLSPISNQRTDQYGGTLENRMRFPLVDRARGARRGAQGRAARRPHHRQRLARRRADAGRRGGDRQGAQGEGLDFICVSSGGVTADTRNPTDARLQRADRRTRASRKPASRPARSA